MSGKGDEEERKEQKRREQKARSARLCRDRNRKRQQRIQEVFDRNERRMGALNESADKGFSLVEAGSPGGTATTTVGSSRSLQFRADQSNIGVTSNTREEPQTSSTDNGASQLSRLVHQRAHQSKSSEKNKNLQDRKDSEKK